MNYALVHNSAERAGVMAITRVGSTFLWHEEYSETAASGVVFQANTTTGDIEYTSTSVGTAANLTYSLNYFS